MKYQRSLFIFLLFLGFGYAGCTKFIDFEGDDATPRLVLNGLMSPDTAIQVTLSNSVGYLSNDPIQRRTDGTVALRDGDGNLIEILQHVSDGIYTGNTLTTPGSRYTITAEHPGFESVSATDRVPIPVPILFWDTARVEVDNIFESGEGLEIRFQFADPPGEENYYMVEVLLLEEYYLNSYFDPNTGEFINDTIWLSEPVLSNAFLSSSDQVFAAENDGFLGESQVYGDQFYFSDALFEGSTREFVLRMYEGPQGTSYRLRLTSLSHDYFRYRQTARRFFNSNGDPFAEPVQVFSNVEGGLGILGGASNSEVLIE